VTVEQVAEAQVMKVMKAQLTDPLAIFRLAFLFRPRGELGSLQPCALG
jgi:hypothetical protein